MATRTSARSGKRQSQSPKRQQTRSQSAELGDNYTTDATRERQDLRQGSVDSNKSGTSIASSVGARTRKATRKAVAAQELSIVAEDREAENSQEEESAAILQLSPDFQQVQSPGGASQMSGTTAISSITAYSAGEVRDLDEESIAEYLPELFTSSCRILDLLAPADPSKQNESYTDSIARELKVLGSRPAKKLKSAEEIFNVHRQHYGKDFYINTSYIFRKLFQLQDPGEGKFRPDPILYAANLATLVREFLVIQKESPHTNTSLLKLDRRFPVAFVRKFNSNLQFGDSALLDECFALSLEIRTQHTIASLEAQKDQDGWDPEEILASTFYNLADRTPELSPILDAVKNGSPKNILESTPNSDEQITMIDDRVQLIRESFRQNEDAIELGDLVDFEQLEKVFPWSQFLSDLVHWSRLRLSEIHQSIEYQGGIEEIRNLLEAAQGGTNYQGGTEDDEAIQAPQLSPAADIDCNPASFYSGPTDVLGFLRLKKSSSSGVRPSNQQLPVTASSGTRTGAKPSFRVEANPSSKGAAINSQNLPDDRLSQQNDGHNNTVEQSQASVSTYMSSWKARSNERNKENIPSNSISQTVTGKMKRLVDRHPDAQRVEWDDSQDNSAETSTTKRSRHLREESETTEDGGYQADQRQPDPARRAMAPPGRRHTPVEEAEDAPAPAKRVKVHRFNNTRAGAGSGTSHRDNGLIQQVSTRRVAPAEEYEDSNNEDDPEDEDEDAPPLFSQVSLAARHSVARATMANKPTQRRTFWSENDTEYLRESIELHGCSWSELSKLPGWEVDRDQVALKDKARNMKVAYLKNPHMHLPVNFDKIALGKKEIAAIQRARPDWQPYDD